jgi:cupin domain
VSPGGRVAAPHVHPGATERFHVLAGRILFQVGERQAELGAGQSCKVPTGTSHDWWHVGPDEAQVLVEVTPGDRFVRIVTTTFGLARDGRVDARGLPHLLQAAVSPRDYRDTIVFSPPAARAAAPLRWARTARPAPRQAAGVSRVPVQQGRGRAARGGARPSRRRGPVAVRGHGHGLDLTGTPRAGYSAGSAPSSRARRSSFAARRATLRAASASVSRSRTGRSTR